MSNHALQRKHRWWWILAVPALVLLVWSLTGNGNTDPATPIPAAPPAEPQAAPPPAPPASPLTEVGPGKYEVGAGAGQVAAGKYKSPGPASGLNGICYYARLKEGDGGADDIRDNKATQGPSVFTVSPSDGYVEVSGCTFTKQA